LGMTKKQNKCFILLSGIFFTAFKNKLVGFLTF
jgi:hypothetical protein